MATQHLVEDCYRPQSRRFLQKRHDLGLEDGFQWVRPSPRARLRLLGRKPWALRDPITRRSTDICFGSGCLNGVVLSELHEKPHLLIGYVATRHKGGSPFQKNLDRIGPAAITDAETASRLGREVAAKPKMLVGITLANKMARQIWAMLTKDEDHRDPALVGAA